MDFIGPLAIAVPPPAEGDRIPLPEQAWELFESYNGFVAPSDYRALFDRWGAGLWGFEQHPAWLGLQTPFEPGGLEVQTRDAAETCSSNQRWHSDSEPDFPVWPQAGGFMPLADTEDGFFGWFREGSDPNGWTVGHWARDGALSSARYPMGIGEFIYRFMVGALGTGLDEMAQDEAPNDPQFFPYPFRPAPVLDEELRSRHAVIVTDGIGPTNTVAGISSAEESYRLAPSQLIITEWSRDVVAQGMRVWDQRVWNPAGEYWEIHLTIPPGLWATAEALAAQLPGRLGVPIRQYCDEFRVPIWPDLPRSGRI